MDSVITTEYDGCGKCLVGVRRLSRKTDATSSPTRQADQVLGGVAEIGGHIVAWADDWEVSGATDPLKRPGFGPWLRGEMGPYDGIAAASVDRVGRNVRDTLNTQDLLIGQGRILVTADHVGVWDFSDPNQENEWMIKAWGSQMELRSIQKRNRDETLRARAAGQPKQKPSYGFQYVRLTPTGKVDHVAIDEVAAAIIRNVAERILADQTGKVSSSTEAARLNRAGVPSPSDRRAQLYGRPLKGNPWTGKGVRDILISKAALGYLMHAGMPVIGQDGRPVRLADPLWDVATHDALIMATAPKRDGSRSPKTTNLCSGLTYCGNCGARTYIAGRTGPHFAYGCTARVRGIVASQLCKPAPSVAIPKLDAMVTEWFLTRYGSGEVLKQVYDPGTGHAAQIAALEVDRQRLREDRAAGLYDDTDDAEWFRATYARMSAEIKELRALPERAPSMRNVPTGRTVAMDWHAAPDDAVRREMLHSYDVRVVIHPRSTPERVVITGRVVFTKAA